MYRLFFCHRLILDIARRCSLPGHTTPQSRLPLSPGTHGPAHPGQTRCGFPNLGGGCSEPSPSPAAPGPSPGPGRRARRCPGVGRCGPGSVFPHKRAGSLRAGPGGATQPRLASHYAALNAKARAGRGSFRKEQDPARPTSHYITLTLKQRFMIGAPNARSTPEHAVGSLFSKNPRTSTHTYNPLPFAFPL